MQKAEEAAAEAETEGGGAFAHEGEGGVVDLELADSELERLEIVRADRIDAAEDERVDFFEARKRLRGRFARLRKRVADFHVGGGLHVGNEVTDITCLELFAGGHLRAEDADVLDFVIEPGGHHADFLATDDGAAHDANVADDAAIGVEHGIEHGGAQIAITGVFRMRDVGHDGLEDVLDADAHFGAGRHGFISGELEDILELAFALVDIGAGEIDFVDDGDDVQVLLQREVQIGHRLGLHALGGIDQEQSALASGERAADLVAEIDVPRRVEEVQLVHLAVAGLVVHTHGVRLDGDAALALQIHRIQELVLLLPHGDGLRELEKAVGERGLPVVDVCDDGEVTGVFDGHPRGGAKGGVSRPERSGMQSGMLTAGGARQANVESPPEARPARTGLPAAASRGVRIDIEVEIQLRELLQGEAEQDAVVGDAIAVVTNERADGEKPAAEVAREAVALELHCAVVRLKDVVHAEAPVFRETGVDAGEEQIAILREERVVIQELMTELEGEVAAREEGDGVIQVREAARSIGKRELDVGGEIDPRDGAPEELVVEIGHAAIELRITCEDVHVGVHASPGVGAAGTIRGSTGEAAVTIRGEVIATSLEEVVHPDACDVPRTKGIDRGEERWIDGTRAGGRGEAIDAWQRAVHLCVEVGVVDVRLDDVTEAVQAPFFTAEIAPGAGDFERGLESRVEDAAGEITQTADAAIDAVIAGEAETEAWREIQPAEVGLGIKKLVVGVEAGETGLIQTRIKYADACGSLRRGNHGTLRQAQKRGVGRARSEWIAIDRTSAEQAQSAQALKLHLLVFADLFVVEAGGDGALMLNGAVPKRTADKIQGKLRKALRSTVEVIQLQPGHQGGDVGVAGLHEGDLIVRLRVGAELVEKEVFVEMDIAELVDIEVDVPRADIRARKVDAVLEIDFVACVVHHLAGRASLIQRGLTIIHSVEA